MDMNLHVLSPLGFSTSHEKMSKVALFFAGGILEIDTSEVNAEDTVGILRLLADSFEQYGELKEETWLPLR